jgi:hypothetical protein
LFHPAATSRVCPSGACPSLRSRTGFPRPIHALLPLNAIACDQRPRPRLQGFAPRCECGVGRNGLGPDRSAPLLGFSSSGCSLRATWECLHIPSAPDLSTAKNPSRLALGVSPLHGLACLDSGCRPARAFWPEPPSSFRKSGSRPVSGDPPEPPDTQNHRARVVPASERRKSSERLEDSIRPARTIWTPFCAAAGDFWGKAVTPLWTRGTCVSVAPCELYRVWTIDQQLSAAHKVASDLRAYGSRGNAERRSCGIRRGRPRASST